MNLPQVRTSFKSENVGVQKRGISDSVEYLGLFPASKRQDITPSMNAYGQTEAEAIDEYWL